ncbi:hypothetical protein BC936DRAFT_143988 [Jimgerdemannia flammicorona]|uniref:Ketoreductase domain-containing protein n=1 Tax=Jimgerdemannia flammicorona TaxID=994334 RepID=A0A433DD58_9FUNG|nr:hypothetical protein BC936DRAFT_143988 [Jimgerdemannia flammicorona]
MISLQRRWVKAINLWWFEAKEARSQTFVAASDVTNGTGPAKPHTHIHFSPFLWNHAAANPNCPSNNTPSPNPFTSQVAVVTGGTRGIGLAIAERFVNHGATIIVLSRDSSRVASAVERLEAIDADGTFRTHKGYVCDVGEGMEVEQVFKVILRALCALGFHTSFLIPTSTQIDYLINAAGISRDDLLIQLKPNDLHETLRTNLMGTIHTCRAAAKAMLRRRKGVIRIRNFLIPVQRRHCCIINLSSVVGIQGHVGQTIYSATKAGVIGFSKSLSKELGSRNVRVNVLAPGFIQTDMTSGIVPAAPAHRPSLHALTDWAPTTNRQAFPTISARPGSSALP